MKIEKNGEIIILDDNDITIESRNKNIEEIEFIDLKIQFKTAIKANLIYFKRDNTVKFIKHIKEVSKHINL